MRVLTLSEHLQISMLKCKQLNYPFYDMAENDISSKLIEWLFEIKTNIKILLMVPLTN